MKLIATIENPNHVYFPDTVCSAPDRFEIDVENVRSIRANANGQLLIELIDGTFKRVANRQLIQFQQS